VKLDFREVGWSMKWIDLAQGKDKGRAVVNEVLTFRFP
jgi:hypothetical protein